MSNKIDIQELMKILPELVRTNDELKGAIISALSGVVATKNDIEILVEQSNQRFIAMQKQMDERFNAMQKQMDERFNAMQKQMDERFQQMDERFQQMDERFNAMQKQIDNRFNAMQKQIDNRFDSMQKQMDEIRVEVMTLNNKEGGELEELILKLMKETLQLNNVNPEKIRKETLIDTSGELFSKGFSTDIDVLLENGNTYLVEVKAKADSRDFYHLKRVGQLYENERKITITGLIMVSLRINDKTIIHGSNTNIKIIAGSIINTK